MVKRSRRWEDTERWKCDSKKEREEIRRINVGKRRRWNEAR